MSEWPLATTVARGCISYMPICRIILMAKILCSTRIISVCIIKIGNLPSGKQKQPIATMVARGHYDMITYSYNLWVA